MDSIETIFHGIGCFRVLPVIAPVMMICIYYGIPPAAARKKDGLRRTSLFFCLSCPVVCRHPARTATRLVALGCVQRAFSQRSLLLFRGLAAAARSQPFGCLALPVEMEHRAARV